MVLNSCRNVDIRVLRVTAIHHRRDLVRNPLPTLLLRDLIARKVVAQSSKGSIILVTVISPIAVFFEDI